MTFGSRRIDGGTTRRPEPLGFLEMQWRPWVLRIVGWVFAGGAVVAVCTDGVDGSDGIWALVPWLSWHALRYRAEWLRERELRLRRWRTSRRGPQP